MAVSVVTTFSITWATPATIRDVGKKPYQNLPPRSNAEEGLIDLGRWLNTANSAQRQYRSTAQHVWVENLTQRGITVPRRSSVAAFVERYPDVASAMETPLSLVHRYFPDASRIVVDTFDEVEGHADPEFQSLLMTIEMTDPAPNALERLDGFDQEWWYVLPPETAARICSHLHFI